MSPYTSQTLFWEGLFSISVPWLQLTVSAVFQADFETLKREAETELNSKLESKTKGLEKIVIENERLRKEIKRVTSSMTYYKFVLMKLGRGRINYSKKKKQKKKPIKKV